MNETILFGRGCEMMEMPRARWEQHLTQVPQHSETRLAFMSDEHHLVRYFVVRELPRVGEPIPPARISRDLGLPLERVMAILGDLEENIFFLFRNDQGAVAWAYPITVDETPHHLTFSTGERLYGA